MKYFYTILCLLFCLTIFGQQVIREASINEAGKIQVKTYLNQQSQSIELREDYLQLDNFPFAKGAHPSFKNTRNITLADINDDGQDEVLVCLNETLYAILSNGEIGWSYTLSGTSNYPPAVADIDQDGDLEIVCQTYGIPAVGNVYLFDHEGNLQDGWPFNSSNHFFLNAITLADINSDGNLEIICSERVSSAEGKVHALDLNAESINSGWPVTVAGTPAVTPSVADVDMDGLPELVTSSTSAIYMFNDDGTLVDGFPFEEEGSRFSYQSPILVDLDDDELLEIVGARHGDKPGTYVLNNDGTYHGNWPHFDNMWTYAPPSVADVDEDGSFEIFYGRPYTSETEEGSILLGYDADGNDLANFPKQGFAGTEGILAIADIDGDGDYEIITPSKITMDDQGFIHAYHIETMEEVDKFPLRVDGFTFLNGAYLGDVDGDEMLDLTALSYQLKFNGASPDSAFINVFNLEVPFNSDKILFNGYKGSNDHRGLVQQNIVGVESTKLFAEDLIVYPNPSSKIIQIDRDDIGASAQLYIFNQLGQQNMKTTYRNGQIDIESLVSGNYKLLIVDEGKSYQANFIKVD